MVREFAILTPIVVMLLAGLACLYGAATSLRALGRLRARLLLLVIAGFAWLVSAMVLIQAARAVRPSGVAALAGEIIHLGALGPAVADLQWSADAVSLAAAGVLYVFGLAVSLPHLAREGRAAARGDLEPPQFEAVGRSLLHAAGGWTLLFAHSLPSMVIGAGLLLFAEANAEPSSRRVAGGWSLIAWLALMVITYLPGRPPTTTTLSLLGAAGQRSILVRTEVLAGLTYADTAVAALLVAFGGLVLGRRTRAIAAPVAAVIAVHVNAILALSVWGMASFVFAGALLALTPWLRRVERADAAAFVGSGLVLVCVGMGQFVEALWVGLTVPAVVVVVAWSKRGMRLATLATASIVWGPAWLMASVGASVASAALNLVVAGVAVVSTFGLATRLAESSEASDHVGSYEADRHVQSPVVGGALASITLVAVVTARWLGPLTQPLQRLLAVSAQFEGALALGVLPVAQAWGPVLELGLGLGAMVSTVGLGAWIAPRVRVTLDLPSLVEAFATGIEAALSMLHSLGVELRNRWWGFRWGGSNDTRRGRSLRQLGWALFAVLAAAVSLHRCPGGAVDSPVYDAPGLSPRLVSPQRSRPLQTQSGQPDPKTEAGE